MARHLKGRSKRLSKALTGAAVVSMLLMGSNATISGYRESSRSEIQIASGSVALQLNGAKQTTLKFDKALTPGSSYSKSLTVSNVGTVPLEFSAATLGADSGPLASVLDATLTYNGTTIATGKLNQLQSSGVNLEVGESGVVELAIGWVSSDHDDTFKKSSGSTTLTFISESRGLTN